MSEKQTTTDFPQPLNLQPMILAVRPNSISESDKCALRQEGVIVIEHENPKELRFIRPDREVDGSDMFVCAMRALDSSIGQGADSQRIAFTKLLARLVIRETTDK